MTLGAIALIAAYPQQGVRESLSAGMALRCRVIAPHFDFRLAAVRAWHVIRERPLQIRRRHLHAPTLRQV